jgi:hypothetical protein
MYLVMFFLGTVWLIMSASIFLKPNANPLVDYIPAWALLVAGLAFLYMGVESYLLREDPEIWR